MTPDEAVEAVKIIEELAARGSVYISGPTASHPEYFVASVDRSSRIPEHRSLFGPTLLSALRAAKEGA